MKVRKLRRFFQRKFLSAKNATKFVRSTVLLSLIHSDAVALVQGWGIYLLSRAAWIVNYRWRAAKINQFHSKILPLYKCEEEWLLLPYYLITCLSRSFVLTWCCTLTSVTKIWMRAISNLHAGRRSPTPCFSASGENAVPLLCSFLHLPFHFYSVYGFVIISCKARVGNLFTIEGRINCETSWAGHKTSNLRLMMKSTTKDQVGVFFYFGTLFYFTTQI